MIKLIFFFQSYVTFPPHLNLWVLVKQPSTYPGLHAWLFRSCFVRVTVKGAKRASSPARHHMRECCLCTILSPWMLAIMTTTTVLHHLLRPCCQCSDMISYARLLLFLSHQIPPDGVDLKSFPYIQYSSIFLFVFKLLISLSISEYFFFLYIVLRSPSYHVQPGHDEDVCP